ncbi:Glucose 1-dehydrogenase [Wickerhamiella sorbophila]|uniref:Glucose 1-dehydrogenase n=1 Tax=Wickerhamiella sorbophila TaxID=45607 RepID=A0A2T0FDY4_9ASCO|nr:Glucose 1-dehydrogenase [Wickerhamiella sorbophila]PRT53213.1 Glucose 1-dehydrogenase [Wickerhamiella sorbophila]
MVGRLANKNTIITGAAGGIGLETAIQFLKEGANVVISDVNDKGLTAAEQKIKEVVGSFEGKLVAKVADVSNEVQVMALVEVCEPWGGVDVMFNNAGIMHPEDNGILNTEEKIWDLTQAINVKGVVYGCRAAIKSLLEHKKPGSIINTGSFVGLMGAATPQIAYTASKGAVLAISRELAVCYAQKNIRVNALCPGPLNTPLLQAFLDTDEKRTRRTVHLPMGRFGEAIEQAKAAVFLASDESSYVTGQDFLVDGGLTRAYVTDITGSAAAPKNLAFGL